MSHPFDATLKEVVEAHAADFVPVFGLPTDLPPITLNVDLSTLSAATDVAIGFGEPPVEIADLNFQSGPDPQLESRLHLYNAALHHRYQVPVRTILVLLRPITRQSQLGTRYSYARGETRVEFDYEVVRLWERPVAAFLSGGLGLLPLATLCEMPRGVPLGDALTDVVREIDRRLLAETTHERAATLMTAACILAGTRVNRETLAKIFSGAQIMHESSAYELFRDQGRELGLKEGLKEGLEQGLEQGRELGLEQGLEQGRRQELQSILLRQGRRRFGTLPAEAEASLRAIDDLERLERMADAVLTATTWDELLAPA